MHAFQVVEIVRKADSISMGPVIAHDRSQSRFAAIPWPGMGMNEAGVTRNEGRMEKAIDLVVKGTVVHNIVRGALLHCSALGTGDVVNGLA